MWSIDVSPHRAIGSASATDFVVSLPAVDRSSTRVISEVPLQTNRVDSPFGGPSLDPVALQGTLVPSCELLTFVSPDSVRGACAWLNSVGEVELFQYGVGRTLYGIKGTY